MTECSECKHFYQEFDTNYQECKKEGEVAIKDEWWEGEEVCPYWEDREKGWDGEQNDKNKTN